MNTAVNIQHKDSIHGKTSPLGNTNNNFIDPKNLSPEYVTGLCEGESGFTYSRNGGGINLRFGLKLNDKDKNLIFAIQGFFSAGSIYFSGSKESGGSWFYCVTRIDELGKIVDHFRKYPFIGRKIESFEIWSKMYELKKTPRKTDMEAINTLAASLSMLSSRRKRSE